MTGIIYFIREMPDGAIKIGWASDDDRVYQRIRAMQTGNSRELKVVHTIPGNMGEEYAWHARFRAFCIRNEWFRPAHDLLVAIGLESERDTPLPKTELNEFNQPVWDWMRRNGFTVESFAAHMGYSPATLRQSLFSSYGRVWGRKMAARIEAATNGELTANGLLAAQNRHQAKSLKDQYGRFFNEETCLVDHDGHHAWLRAQRKQRRLATANLQAESAA